MSAPTYEELSALVVVLRSRLVAQDERMAAQDGRIAELERQLAATSRNSSKPPSGDGLGKPPAPAPKSLRGRSGRKPGGQPGHPGRTLRRRDDPDRTVSHRPASCGGCGDTLPAGAGSVRVARRQVFDIPEVVVSVTEHQLHSVRCACGAVTAADAPAGVAAPVQYGPHAAAIAVYLVLGQHLPVERTAGLLADLFGTPMSVGTVAAWTSRAAAGLEPFTDAARAAVTGAEVVHADETGFRVAGRLHWLHVACTALFTVLFCHAKRGRVAMDAAGVLTDVRGVLVHDAYAPYNGYGDATHALCNAHVLRELIAVTDHHATSDRSPPADSDLPPDWCWAQQVIDHLLALKKITDTGRLPTADELAEHRRAITDAAIIGADPDTAGPGPVGAKHLALARRLDARIDDYTRFAVDPAVPFDNNQAERDIRMAKIKQKVSGGMRTLQGAQDLAAMRSYLATAAKHGRRPFDA